MPRPMAGTDLWCMPTLGAKLLFESVPEFSVASDKPRTIADYCFHLASQYPWKSSDVSSLIIFRILLALKLSVPRQALRRRKNRGLSRLQSAQTSSE